MDSLPLTHQGSPETLFNVLSLPFILLLPPSIMNPSCPALIPKEREEGERAPGEERGGSGSNRACICSSGSWCWGVMAAAMGRPPAEHCVPPPRFSLCRTAAWSAAADSSR